MDSESPTANLIARRLMTCMAAFVIGSLAGCATSLTQEQAEGVAWSMLEAAAHERYNEFVGEDWTLGKAEYFDEGEEYWFYFMSPYFLDNWAAASVDVLTGRGSRQFQQP